MLDRWNALSDPLEVVCFAVTFDVPDADYPM
jgi:hypothetical protein